MPKSVYFRQIIEKAELEEAFSIRYKVYGQEMGIINIDKYPDKMISDKFDSIGTHFAAFSDNKMIGIIRIVEDSPLGLPLEKSFIEFEKIKKNKEGIAEFTRMMILPEYRRTLGSGKVFLGLIKLGFIHALSRNIKYIVAHCYTDDQFTPIELLKRIGFVQLCEPYMEDKLYGYMHPITVLMLDISLLFEKLKGIDNTVIEVSKYFNYKNEICEDINWSKLNLINNSIKLNHLINYPVYCNI